MKRIFCPLCGNTFKDKSQCQGGGDEDANAPSSHENIPTQSGETYDPKPEDMPELPKPKDL